MKQWIGLVLLIIRLQAAEQNDQLHVLFGSSGYVLYKALDFASDHGFRYVKILSYEFHAFDHTIAGKWDGAPPGGRIFELKDETATVSFCCFTAPPSDIYTIEVEKYRSILDDVASGGE